MDQKLDRDKQQKRKSAGIFLLNILITILSMLYSDFLKLDGADLQLGSFF